jgi:hypothetical protein
LDPADRRVRRSRLFRLSRVKEERRRAVGRLIKIILSDFKKTAARGSFSFFVVSDQAFSLKRVAMDKQRPRCRVPDGLQRVD